MTFAIIFHVIFQKNNRMIRTLMKHVSDLNEIDKELKVEISSDYDMQIVCE